MYYLLGSIYFIHYLLACWVYMLNYYYYYYSSPEPFPPALPAQLLSAFPYLLSRDLLPFKRALVLLHNSLSMQVPKPRLQLNPSSRHDGFIGISNVKLHPSFLMRRAASSTIAIDVSLRRSGGIIETPICNHSLINISITIIFGYSISV